MSTGSVKALYQPHPWRWLAHVGADWLLIILAFFFAYQANTLLACWLASLLIGNRQHAIAIMGHDGAHFAASRNKSLNDLLTVLFAFYPLAVSLKGYRKMHFAHHSHNGMSGDPELISKAEMGHQFDFPFRKRKLAGQLARDLVGIDPRMFINLAYTMRPKKLRYYSGVVAFQLTFWAACILTHQYWILALWYFSLMTSFIACFRMRIWIEHMGTNATHRVTLNPLQRFLFAPHHTENHFEHHQWPWVPCWNLSKARRFETTTPIMTLGELFAYYESCPAPVADTSRRLAA